MKNVKLFLVIVGVIGVGILGAYTKSIWPTQSDGDIVGMPTETIGKDQSIGGVATTNEAASAEPSAASDKTTSTTPSPSKTLAFEDVAPKQAEVKRSTTIEYEYRALRTSNDPLPQPVWSMSATRTQTAWDSSTGNGAIVAVIDSGFALAHEDLANQWHQNTNETGLTALGGRCWTGTPANKSTNNCDDDNNGYSDDWRGWDFVSVNNLPQAGEANPSGAGVAHGTEVAGLVGATGNNGVGTATLSWNNKIMPLQALSDDGSGFTSGIAAAVYYAVDNGAAVINMSLGGSSNDPTLAQAVRYAYDRNVVVVAAAGNCGTGMEQGCDPAKAGAMGYPALNPHVIAVGATTSSNNRAGFSSYGPGIDVSAPGSGTLISPLWSSSNQTSAYATSLYGTSFASPIVASYAGLIKSLRPSSSSDDITALINATAWKPSAMSGAPYSTTLGHGIIDAEAGLRVASSLNASTATPALLQTGGARSEHTFETNTSLSSGCEVIAGTYCTIWATNNSGYDRYLPYTQTNGSGQAGWSWASSWLGDGDWSLKARSGNTPSTTPYQLVNR